MIDVDLIFHWKPFSYFLKIDRKHRKMGLKLNLCSLKLPKVTWNLNALKIEFSFFHNGFWDLSHSKFWDHPSTEIVGVEEKSTKNVLIGRMYEKKH